MQMARLSLLHADNYCLVTVDLGERHRRRPTWKSKSLLQESRCSSDVHDSTPANDGSGLACQASPITTTSSIDYNVQQTHSLFPPIPRLAYTPAMSAPRLCAVLACLLAPALAVAQTPPPTAGAANAITAPAQKTIGMPAARKHSEALIVLNARGVRLAGPSLTLDGVAPSATLFASRPARGAGHMLTTELVELWTTGSFAKDPPNATVSAFAKDGSKVTDAVVTLRAPKLAGDRLTFDVAVLEGSLGDADGPASVFIDTIWFGVGSGGFTYLGQSQTTGGTTPAFGSKGDTSTMSGWSNPAPSNRPYNPGYNTGYNIDRGPGAGPPPDYRAPSCGAPPLLPCY